MVGTQSTYCGFRQQISKVQIFNFVQHLFTFNKRLLFQIDLLTLDTLLKDDILLINSISSFNKYTKIKEARNFPIISKTTIVEKIVYHLPNRVLSREKTSIVEIFNLLTTIFAIRCRRRCCCCCCCWSSSSSSSQLSAVFDQNILNM